MDAREIARRFAHHPPKDEATAERHAEVRAQCADLAATIVRLVPEGRERSVAIRKLEETMMWSNAGIARS